MDRTPGKDEAQATVRAVRYILVMLDEIDRQVAGRPPGTTGVTMTIDEALALAPALAHQVIDALSSMAAELGRTPDERSAFIRNLLLARLQGAELDVMFAGVEAEERGGG